MISPDDEYDLRREQQREERQELLRESIIYLLFGDKMSLRKFNNDPEKQRIIKESKEFERFVINDMIELYAEFIMVKGLRGKFLEFCLQRHEDTKGSPAT